MSATARSRGISCFAGNADVRRLAEAEKLSIEMAARKARHEFLAQTALREGYALIALAHHLDDQLELFLLRMMRGSGVGGLSGMRWRSPSPADRRISLVRPLLEQTKASLREYASVSSIPFREDVSNECLGYARNRVRHLLVPAFKELQPEWNKSVARTVEFPRADSDFIASSAAAWVENASRQEFGRLPVSLQRQVLRCQLFRKGIDSDFDRVEHLRTQPGIPIAVGPRKLILRDPSGLLQEKETCAEFDPDFIHVQVSTGGSVQFGNLVFRWSVQPRQGMAISKQPNFEEVFDAEKVGNQILLRHWRQGDRFQPIGMECSVKLQDLLVNARIPRERRHQLVLAARADATVFWVEDSALATVAKLGRPPANACAGAGSPLAAPIIAERDPLCIYLWTHSDLGHRVAPI